MTALDLTPFRRRDPGSVAPLGMPREERRGLGNSTVLVVDDDADVRTMMSTLLVLEGYHVLTAENGEQALAAMRRRHPCVVLLDIMMPVMDGWQFRRQQL